MNEIDEIRRNFLIKALTSGLFAAGAMGLTVSVWAMGRIPDELPAGKSIYKLEGDVKVDNMPANLDTNITTGSVIETGVSGKIIFVVGKDAFILRESSKLEMSGGELVVSSFRLITGKLLSVFGQRQNNQSLRLNTVTATVGIRGTGVYLEAEPEQTYICTCYGKADLASLTDAQSRETVVTEHHDAPRYILANAPVGRKIIAAPVINHTDEELELIESLVGRDVPFALSGGYDSLRNTNY